MSYSQTETKVLGNDWNFLILKNIFTNVYKGIEQKSKENIIRNLEELHKLPETTDITSGKTFLEFLTDFAPLGNFK